MATSSFESPKADEFRGLDMDALYTDEAYLNSTSNLYEDGPAYLYKRSTDCDRCPFVRVGEEWEEVLVVL